MKPIIAAALLSLILWPSSVNADGLTDAVDNATRSCAHLRFMAGLLWEGSNKPEVQKQALDILARNCALNPVIVKEWIMP